MKIVGCWLVIGLACVAIAGCKGADKDKTNTPDGRPDTASIEVSDDPGVNNVPVSMAEFEIKMSPKLASGPTKFVVTNNGQLAHNLQIKGGGIDQLLAKEPIAPGDKATMQINLARGQYSAYCPMFNHRDKGMEYKFKVE